MSEPARSQNLELTGAQRATIDSLLKGEAPIPAPEWLAREAAIDDELERRHLKAQAMGEDPRDLSTLAD